MERPGVSTQLQGSSHPAGRQRVSGVKSGGANLPDNSLLGMRQSTLHPVETPKVFGTASDDTTLMAESKEELKSLLISIKES